MWRALPLGLLWMAALLTLAGVAAGCEEESEPAWIDCEGFYCELWEFCGPKNTCLEEPPPPPSGTDGPSGPDWARINADTFLMGSPRGEEGRGAGEEQREVTLSRSFEILRTPVTQEQWVALMGYNPSCNQEQELVTCSTANLNPHAPVERLTWFQMLEYLNRLSERAGYAPCYGLTNWREYRQIESNLPTSVCDVEILGSGSPYDCEGYRLPTEAEWEFAARAGSTEARYGEPDEIAWHEQNSPQWSHPVGQKLPNAWGLYDMLGNVEEVIGEAVDGYRGRVPVTDPFKPPSTLGSSPYLVARGGYWGTGGLWVRAAARSSWGAIHASNATGFRPVRTLSEEESRGTNSL